MITFEKLNKEHLDQVEMREHEAALHANYGIDFDQLLQEAVYGEAALWDGKVLACWGTLADGAIWQLPSVHIATVPSAYAKQAIKVVKQMVKSFPNAYTVCLDDELHNRWMKFIGFKRIDESEHFMFGFKYARFEVA